MIKQRIVETNEGIAGESMVIEYDAMQRKLRDRGVIETKNIISYGINKGNILEIGPGPGYLGLEILKNVKDADLYGLEISSDMINLAEKNAFDYGLKDRVKYLQGDAGKMPFKDNFFDGVITNGSLHEWSEPVKIFNEIFRVLKNGAKFYIGDLKRNINPFIAILMKSMVKSRSIKNGLTASINAAYTANEIALLFDNSSLKNYHINENAFGLTIIGIKRLE